MKKIILTLALAIGFSFATQAQEKLEPVDTKTVKTTQDIVTKDYKEYGKNSLPVSTLEKVGTKYGGYSIEEVFKAADGEYRLTLMKDGKTTTAYFNKKGEEIIRTKK